ncbi:hypothetical protein KO481_26055 [Nocardia sp. NEAU-G5]|uniref:Uncharacterized protein n=1 Tax=Nocardia albiluteola TaxID=2842303 RepID=A0ABS6B3V6_9NOCA|nr:hypothetical protein [Nocardia albiluteola]MBU3064982.1 hypothetical protein [Nocardia albiluteola]
MRLRLKYAPEPANAARFAADIAAAAANVSGVELDYTPDSLGHVDEIIEGFRSDGLSSDQVAETLFGFGCYVGEVLRHNADGVWRPTTEQEEDIFGFPMVMELPTGMVCNPIGKAFKRLDHGPEESVPYFYHVFTSERPGEV